MANQKGKSGSKKDKSKIKLLSMIAGQDRTQVTENDGALHRGKSHKPDLTLAINIPAFANKGDLIKAIDVIRGKADNMDWPPT